MKCIMRTVFLSVLILSLAAIASAQEYSACSAVTTAGQWGYTETGTVFAPSGPVLAAMVGKANFDVNGNGWGTQTTSEATSQGGTVLDETVKGNITVNSDCTGGMTVNIYDSGNLARTAYLDFVIDDRANEIRAIVTKVELPNGASVPTVLTIVFKRMHRG